jgi:hypothetical protein
LTSLSSLISATMAHILVEPISIAKTVRLKLKVLSQTSQQGICFQAIESDHD